MMVAASGDVREADRALERLSADPADALLGLIALYRADALAEKIDLGVGVFRDDLGATPIIATVKVDL